MRPAHYFTYTLGNALYIPLTSRCNSLTLPQTRGPNFTLPPAVVAALCRVRDAEHCETRWNGWCQWLDTQDDAQRMPDHRLVDSIHSNDGNEYDDDGTTQRPTVQELLDEVLPLLTASTTTTTTSTKSQTRTKPPPSIDSIVIAGEGEPTLRMTALETLVSELAATTNNIRVLTNGLLWNDSSATHTRSTPQRLVDCGVHGVSVALASACPQQYEAWMEPQQHTCSSNPHARVVQFIQASVEAGLQVEVTAVQRPAVEVAALEDLVRDLGVTAPVRWRTYFP